MADTAKTRVENIAALQDNMNREISAQALRNLVESITPGQATMRISAEAATVITDTVNFFKITGTTELVRARNFEMDEDGRLTYTGIPDIHVHVAVSLSMEAADKGQYITMRVVKNGDPEESDAIASEVDTKIANANDVVSTAVHYDTMMSAGDFLEVFIQNGTDPVNVTVRHMYFFILGMMSAA